MWSAKGQNIRPPDCRPPSSPAHPPVEHLYIPSHSCQSNLSPTPLPRNIEVGDAWMTSRFQRWPICIVTNKRSNDIIITWYLWFRGGRRNDKRHLLLVNEPFPGHRFAFLSYSNSVLDNSCQMLHRTKSCHFNVSPYQRQIYKGNIALFKVLFIYLSFFCLHSNNGEAGKRAYGWNYYPCTWLKY